MIWQDGECDSGSALRCAAGMAEELRATRLKADVAERMLSASAERSRLHRALHWLFRTLVASNVPTRRISKVKVA